MIKKSFIMGMLCFLLPYGCAKNEEKNAHTVPAAIEHTQQGDSARGPYYDGLIQDFRTTLAGDPNNLAALIGLGNAYFDSGQWKPAATMYEHALLLDPQNADVRTDMGTAYRNIGMPDRALAEYRTALESEPGHVSARYNMGIVLAHDKKDYRAAIRIWDELLKIAPNYPHADDIRTGIAALKKQIAKEGK
jgi:tetratricopeptide (TPR) repeat protein